MTTATAAYKSTWLSDAAKELILPDGLGKGMSARVIDKLVDHESGGRHSYAYVNPPLAVSSIYIGENKYSHLGTHYATTGSIGFTQLNPYFGDSKHNIYIPAQDLSRCAELLNDQFNSANNPGSSSLLKLWYTFYAYNKSLSESPSPATFGVQGHIARTPTELRNTPLLKGGRIPPERKAAKYADQLFSALGLPKQY